MNNLRILTPLFCVLVLSHQLWAKDLKFMGQDYPPFNWLEEGAVKGGMYEVAKRACEKLKYNCSFSIVPLPRALKMLEEGTVDGVLSLIGNPDRAVYANFSSDIIASPVVYLGRKGVAKVGGVEGLAGWTVGGVRGSSSLKMAVQHKEKIKTLVVTEENDSEVLVKVLSKGRYGEKGAIIGSLDVLQFFAKKSQVELEPMLSLEVQKFMIGLSKKSVDAQTLAAFNATIEEMKKSGELKTILAKYSLKAE